MARIVVAPVLLTTGWVSQHVINSGVQGTLIVATVWNLDASTAYQFHMSFVPDGDSQGDINQLVGTESSTNIIAASESRTYRFNHFLDPGDDIQCKASTGAKLALRLSVLEEAP
jgi:hypothetical protein